MHQQRRITGRRGPRRRRIREGERESGGGSGGRERWIEREIEQENEKEKERSRARECVRVCVCETGKALSKNQLCSRIPLYFFYFIFSSELTLEHVGNVRLNKCLKCQME